MAACSIDVVHSVSRCRSRVRYRGSSGTISLTRLMFSSGTQPRDLHHEHRHEHGQREGLGHARLQPQPPSPPLPPSLRPHLSAGIQSPNWSVSMENAKYIQQRRRVVGGTPMYSSPPTTITTNIRLSLFHQYSSCAPPAPHPLHYFEINLCIRVTCDHVQGCQLKQMLIHTL